jgi:hypothetical protein
MPDEFGTAVLDAMQTKGYDLRRLSEKIETTYEHCRKLTLGMAYPSKYLLPCRDQAAASHHSVLWEDGWERCDQ